LNARPLGLTILALLLGWLSLFGFGIARWATQLDPRLDSRPAVRATFGIVGLLYGCSALAAASGLWRLRPWSLRAIYVWGVFVVLVAWLPTFVLRDKPPVSTAIGGSFMLAFLVLIIVLFARSRLQKSRSRAA
jgi:FtsH-binding integral membrane protein